MVRFLRRKLITSIAILLVFPAVSLPAQAVEKSVWLVVTRPIFVTTLEPLVQHRIRDGFEVVISTHPVEEAIASAPSKPDYLVLVGDYQAHQQDQPWFVPSRSQKFYQFDYGQREFYAADALWGALDNDLVPDLPVGRIPVRSAEQLQLVIDKIIAYENKSPTIDDLSLLVWAGSPNFNPILDNLVISTGANLVLKNAPDWMKLWAIVAHPLNALCGWPPDHSSVFNQQLKQGGALAVLIGHGPSD